MLWEKRKSEHVAKSWFEGNRKREKGVKYIQS